MNKGKTSSTAKHLDSNKLAQLQLVIAPTFGYFYQHFNMCFTKSWNTSPWKLLKPWQNCQCGHHIVVQFFY